MAIEKIHTAAENLTVAAATDLRTYQYAPVQISTAGVKIAVADVGSGAAFVLYNEPNSGEAATLIGGPNTAKALAGSTVVIGQPITHGSSASWLATSWQPVGSGAALRVAGIAATAAASGGIFSLRLL